MGETVDVIAEVGQPTGTLRKVLAGVLVVGMTGGMFLLTGGASLAPYPEAGAHVAALHAAGPSALAAAVPVELFDHFEIPQEARQTVFDGIPASIDIQGESVIEAVGVPLVEVVTDTGVWCVRPDGKVLPNCLYGAYEMVALDAGAEIEVFDISPLALRQPLNVVFLLRSPGAEVRTLSGTPELVDESLVWGLRSVDPVVGGQIADPDPNGLPYGGDRELGVQLEGFVGPDQVLPSDPLQIRFGDDAVTFGARTTYWLR